MAYEGFAVSQRRRKHGMRIDLTEIIERGEGAYLIFPMKTRVTYSWHAAGRAHLRQRVQGYLVPVADSIVREQLKNIHVGCEATVAVGGLSEAGADQLDQVFRLAGVPFVVAREPASLYLRNSTENAVWVAFPGSEEIPIQFSRFRKWQPFWGKQALFLWWQCESEQEWQQRMEREWRERGIVPTTTRQLAVLDDEETDDDEDGDEPLETSNHHHE